MNGENLGPNQPNQTPFEPSPGINPSFQPKEEPFSPPPSNVFIRTSELDLEKVQSEGGVFPQTHPLQTPPPQTPPPSQPPPFKPIEDVSFTPAAGFNQPPFNQPPQEPPVFISPQIPESNLPPEIPASELSNLPLQSSPKKKFLPFIIIGVLIIIGLILGYYVLWPRIFKPEKTVEVVPPPTLTVTTTTTTTLPPSPYVSFSSPFEKSIVNINVSGSPILSAIQKEAKETMLEPKSFKILVPKVHNEVLNDEEVILSLIPKLPESLKPYVLGGKKFLVYVYYGEVNPSLGLIVEIGLDNKEMVKPIFLNWEKKLQILKDLSNFYLVKIPAQAGKAFKDVSNLGAEIRTFDYKGEEVDLTYAFFDKYLIISSSLESVNSALERLQRPQEPIYP